MVSLVVKEKFAKTSQSLKILQKLLQFTKNGSWTCMENYTPVSILTFYNLREIFI